MRIADHIAVLETDGKRLADAAERAGVDAEVPACPGWRVRDLLDHLGGVHRWAASYVTTGRSEPLSRKGRPEFAAPETDDALVGWFREGHRALVDALTGADEAVQCWTFLPAPSPLAFWARRQAHETAIHRADVESVTGGVPDWDPAFAADGIDELLNGFLSRPRGRLVSDPPRNLAVAATDVDAAWTITIGPDSRRVVPGAGAADTALTGRANDLYLLLWNRRNADGLDVQGNPAVLDLWRQQARI